LEDVGAAELAVLRVITEVCGVDGGGLVALLGEGGGEDEVGEAEEEEGG